LKHTTSIFLEMGAQETNRTLHSRLLGPPNSNVMQRGSGWKHTGKRRERKVHLEIWGSWLGI